MAKTDKKTRRKLVARLRGLGLRKPLAEKIADKATNVKGQLPDSGRGALKEMIAKVEDLGGEVVKKRRRREPAGDVAESVKTSKKQTRKAAREAREEAKEAARKARRKADKVAKKTRRKADKAGAKVARKAEQEQAAVSEQEAEEAKQ